jgi:hypothetical protein
VTEGSVGTQPAPPALLHRALVIMTIGLATVVALLGATGVAPLLPADESGTSSVIAYVFVVIQMVMLVVCVAVLVPRVPRRRPGQSLEVYWAHTDSGPRLLMVWFFCEGTAVLGLMAFMLVGHPAPAVASAIAMAALVGFGPRRFTDV